MKWIYLSPHLDDAVYSCGGLIREQTQAGHIVEIWTICAGDPPPGPLSPFAEALHARWGTGAEAGQVRRAEDQRAASRLGAGVRHLGVADCIYRRHPVSGEALYASEGAIFGELHPVDEEVVAWLGQLLVEEISSGVRVVGPLTLGGHVDHGLVRTAAERAGCLSFLYADYPYVAQVDADVSSRLPRGWREHHFPVSEESVRVWAEAMALYGSQLSTFWEDEAAMEAELRSYLVPYGGLRVWGR